MTKLVKNKKKLMSLAILFLFIFAFSFAIAGTGAAETLGGLENTGKGVGYNTGASREAKTEIAEMIGNIIAAVMAFVGVVFMVLIIIGAMDIVGAGGNDEKVKEGKDKIKNGAIGVLIVFAAYLFAYLVLTMVSGQAIKIFNL